MNVIPDLIRNLYKLLLILYLFVDSHFHGNDDSVVLTAKPAEC